MSPRNHRWLRRGGLYAKGLGLGLVPVIMFIIGDAIAVLIPEPQAGIGALFVGLSVLTLLALAGVAPVLLILPQSHLRWVGGGILSVVIPLGYFVLQFLQNARPGF